MKKTAFTNYKTALLITGAMLCFYAPYESKAENEVIAQKPVIKQVSENNDNAMQSDTPIAKLDKQTVAMLKDKSEKELKFIYATRNRHDRIRATKYTHKMVSGAVKACSSAQDDMKESLENRYNKWWATLEPLLINAENFVKTSIDSANPKTAEEIKENLDLVEQAQAFTNPDYNKEFATDRQACNFLLENMDITEKHLGDMLRSIDEEIELPEPNPPKANP